MKIRQEIESTEYVTFLNSYKQKKDVGEMVVYVYDTRA